MDLMTEVGAKAEPGQRGDKAAVRNEGDGSFGLRAGCGRMDQKRRARFTGVGMAMALQILGDTGPGIAAPCPPGQADTAPFNQTDWPLSPRTLARSQPHSDQ